NNQPHIGQWNLVRFAETLLPLFMDKKQDASEKQAHETELDDEKQKKAAVGIAQDLLNTYEAQYQAYWLSGFRQKLGLDVPQESDVTLIEDLLNCMESNQADFTLTFYYLSQLGKQASKADGALQQLFSTPDSVKIWLKKWRSRLDKEFLNDTERQKLMKAVNPVYIPRNHQIERAIRAAEDNNDFSVFHALHEVLQNPFEHQADKESYMLPPLEEEIVHQTFCGT
ncbi:MAG: protein adenylyltransferase SelO family protein, partial [Cocleimonas sp.]